MCAGFDGATRASAPLDRLASLGPGGVILFARNIGSDGDVRALTAAIAATNAESPPFVGVDQEGGRVARFRSGVVELPAAMAFGAADDPAATERAAAALARDLRAFGCTVDFAPSADLAVDPDNTVIGSRSFGDDPVRVAEQVAAFVRGLQSGGIAACVKHFPGHGATRGDSHVELPVVDADAATLERREYVPFAAAIDAGASMLMTAHVVVPALDGDRPATLSPGVVRSARERLHFDGVIVSDALEMSAIAATAGIANGAVAALHAGVDCAIVGSDLAAAEAARDAIVAAVETRALALDRLEEAAARVQRLRRVAHDAAVNAAPDAGAGLDIARRAVTAVRGRARLRDGAAVTVVSFEGSLGDGASGPQNGTPSLSAALRARRWKSEIFRVALDPDPDDLALLLAVLDQQNARDVVIMLRRARRYARQRDAAAAVLARFPDAIVVAAREPFDLAALPRARNAVAVYGDEAVSIDGLADVLSGRAPALGVLPVRLDGVADAAS